MLLVEALGFGLAVAFIVVGMIGIVVPILPGMLLVWLTVVVYAWLTGMTAVGWPTVVFVTLVALLTGTAQFWLPLLGAKKTGAAKRALFLGIAGAIIGTLITPLIGTIIGYAAGILLGEYLKHRDLRLALRSSLGGLAGWGIAAVVEFAGALVILVIFVAQVLSG